MVLGLGMCSFFDLRIAKGFDNASRILRNAHKFVVSPLALQPQVGKIIIGRTYILPEDIRVNNNLKSLLQFLYKVAEGIFQLHRYYIVHGDIKPKNILVQFTKDEKRVIKMDSVKITDFGGCVLRLETKQKSSIAHTEPYAAPEIRKREAFDEKIDIYSFGILLAEAITGKHPNNNNNTYTQSEFKGKDELFNIYKECTNQDPQKRPTAKEIYDKMYILYSKALASLYTK
jgi:serine/threonine protein kinase